MAADDPAGLPAHRGAARDQRQRRLARHRDRDLRRPDLTLCGRPSWSATSDDPVRPADVAGASYAGESEDSQGRTLALYASDQVAAKAIDGLRAGLGFCPADPNGSGATQVYDVADADLGEESFVFTQRSRDGDGFLGDLSVYQAVRVGNAVYLATTYGEGGANQQVIDYTVDLMATRSAAVISDLCVFAAEPCGDARSGTDASPAPPHTGPATGEGAVSAIPADFPILDGYPDPSLAEGPTDGIVGPSTDAKDLGFEACGATAPAPDGVDQLGGGWKNPEDYRSRQLTTFATTEAADTFVDGILDVYRSCPTEDTSDGFTRVASVLDGDQGDRSASVVLRYQMQGSFGPGLDITTVVRVGRAVLLSTTYNEGSATTEADVASAAASGADDVTTLVEAMCPWTEQGC